MSQNEMTKLLDIVKKQAAEYNVAYDDIVSRWGIQESIDHLNKFYSGDFFGSNDFIHSWMVMLNSHLESAIWLCVYNRVALTENQKEATKQADDALKNFAKEKKNAL